jgi:hypothetical protein
LITFQYSVSGGGTGYTTPTVTYTQFGTSGNTVTAVTSGGTAVWVDAGTTYTYTNPLSGSSSTEQWSTSTATGTASATGTVSKTYYNQYSFTLSYAVSGGGTGYSAPTLTGTQYGQTYTPTLTGTATAYWLDSGSTWSVANPLGGSSSSERWDTSQTVSGTVSASQTTTFTYYNQYSFTLSYAVSGGGSPTAPTLTAKQFSASYTPTLSTTGTQYWLDAGQSWSITNPLTGSSSSERWDSGQTSSGTVSASSPTTAGGSLTFTYYNEYSFTLSYAVSGGGTGYSAPTLTATQYGALYTPTLGTTGTTYWLDSGKSWSLTNPLGGSGTTERWDTGQTTSGTASASSPTTAGNALTFTYYNQYSMTLSYSVTGGSGYSAPTFSANAFGALAPQTLTTTATGYWFDAGASWTVTNPLAGGSATYRWYTTNSTGTVSVQTIAFVYNYQVFGIATNCEGSGSVANGHTVTTSSMTAQANELIIVVITGNSNLPTVSSIRDNFTTHLTYTREVSYTSSSAGQCLYVEYALTGTHTGPFRITVRMSSNYNYLVQAFGITGANTTTPFDTNSSLPATAYGTSSSKPTVTGVSTSHAYDMILAFEGQTSGTAQTVNSPFTAVQLLNVNSLGNNVEYEIVTSTQSSISVSFGTSVSPWIMAVHAVQRGW